MNEMTISFWGTRGSIPTPGWNTEKYGGNTTCLELRYGDQIIVFDAGSGIREMSLGWLEEFKGAPVNAHLFFTHLHWDHIQGFPFFTAAYMKDNTCTIHGEDRSSGSIEKLLHEQMQGAYFPVPLSAMQAELRFETIAPRFMLEDVTVETMSLPHPGGCTGYRLSTDKEVFVLATDCELDQVALNKEELAKDHRTPRVYDPALLHFFRDANLIVIDCQYTDEAYPQKVGWGHNSLSTVLDLCQQVSPEMVALTHHDPESTDERVMEMVGDAAARLKNTKAMSTLVFAAREGVTMMVRPNMAFTP